MRLVIGALAALTIGLFGLGSWQAPSASAVCDINSDTCTTAFNSLNTSLNTYVPGVHKTTLLRTSALAQDLYPTDPLRACGLLSSINSQTQRLARAGQVSATGLSAIQSALSVLSPTDPYQPSDPYAPSDSYAPVCVPPNPI